MRIEASIAFIRAAAAKIHELRSRRAAANKMAAYEDQRQSLMWNIEYQSGILAGLENLNQVIDIVNEAMTPFEAQKSLHQRLNISHIQAIAILETPIQRLTKIERIKIPEYLEHLKDNLATLQSTGSIPNSRNVDQQPFGVTVNFLDERSKSK